MKKRSLISLLLLLFCTQLAFSQTEKQINVLVLTKTKGFRHESINNGVKSIWELAQKNKWQITATENSDLINKEFLSDVDVVVWLNTTLDVLNDEQQDAFIHFMESGKGYVGIHAAADTEYDWPWYGEMLGGAWFAGHPKTQEGTLVIEDTNPPAMKPLKDNNIERWSVTDEWYTYKANPRSKVNVLMSLDEATVKDKGDNAEKLIMGDHPSTWYLEMDGGGRVFYTGRGHTPESFDEPIFRDLLTGAIEWAAGKQ
jgi:type 1 glutamine amidotransferase